MAADVYRPKKKSKLTSASDVLQSLLQNSNNPMSYAFVVWRLNRSWVDVVGEELAKNSRPVNFIKKTLYVGVPHPAWVNELSFLKENIKNQVNRYLGEDLVQGVRLVVSPINTK